MSCRRRFCLFCQTGDVLAEERKEEQVRGMRCAVVKIVNGQHEGRRSGCIVEC